MARYRNTFYKMENVVIWIKICTTVTYVFNYIEHSWLWDGPRGAVDSTSDSRAIGTGFVIRSGHILSQKGSCQLLAKVFALVRRSKHVQKRCS